MAKTHYLQSNFTAGVLDPRLSSRHGIRQYYDGMSVGRNVVVVPLGGVKRRPGMRFVTELPARAARVSTGITPTATNGGTAANANDDSRTTLLTTTANLSTTSPYVVVHYDLGAAKTIIAADVRDILITSGTSTSEFSIQYSTDNVNWVLYGTGFASVTTESRSYARTETSGATTARYWRVARSGTLPDLGTAKVTISGFNVYEAGATSEARLFPFERSDSERYVVALTDGFATVVQNGAIVVTVPTDYASADLADIDAAQSQDTMVLVHEDYAPQQLLRESATNWQMYDITFDGIPQYDFDDASSPAASVETQRLTFTSFAEGNTFQLELQGARTGPIAWQPTSVTTTAENIRRAVQKLYTVGFTGVSVTNISATVYDVTFAEASADAYDLMIGTTLSGSGTIAVTRTATGSPRREPAWSATRGYPRTVTFHEGRLWLGGTRSLLQAYFGSVVNDFFNFETGEGLDDDAVFGVLNTAQLNAVVALKSGRFLQLFTSGGEFRFTSSPITPADAPRNQTEYGAAKIRPISTDGATLYVQRTRKAIRDFLYRYEEDAYSSVPVSVLAQHLISGIVDIASWQGADNDDANYVFVVNDDGTIAVLNTLRSQEVNAWTQWDTDGEWKAVACVGEDRYFAALRTINGADRVMLEIADEDYYTDCAKQAEPVAGFFTHLIGETVRVLADGFVLTSVVVNGSGNVIIVDSYTPTLNVEAGLNWPVSGPYNLNVEVTTMPLSSPLVGGSNYLVKKRVVNMYCHVYETLGLLYNGRVLPDAYFDLDNFDEAPTPYTGEHELEESTDWRDGILTQTFGQVDPLPMHITGFDIQLETST